jgi:formylglycine-generating enzyme required for sulfatase activity/uncharacterized protein YjdB
MKKQAICFLSTVLCLIFASCENLIILMHGEKPIDTSVVVTGVSLNMTNTAILVGKTETLIAIVTPDNATNKAVKWRSSNDAVATVENGVVTGVTVGSADIIVTTVNGNKTATCAVTVSADVVDVTGVTLNKASTAFTVGITEKLFANISPSNATNQNVNWSSDKPAIASVTQDGSVTGVSVGSAEITVTTVDGNKTAICAVSVSATSVAVTSVVLNKQNTSIAVNSSETLIATVSPTNATNQNVTWESEDPAIATVTNGIIIGKSAGLTVITVKTVDQGKTANCIVTVTTPVNPIYDISLSSGGGSLTSHTFPGATQGYGAQTALTVTVQNIGNQATGALTIVRSGTNFSSFTLSTSSLSSIAVSGSGTFTVTPNTGLSSGTYSATITVSGGNGISAQFNVSFVVNADSISTTFSSVTANGSYSQTTTALTLQFSTGITNLSVSDITLSGISGITKGTLTGSNPYTLPISGFSAGGTLTIAVVKTGFTITGSPKTVSIYYYVPVPANFVRIEGGTFTMGSPSNEPLRRSNEVQHQVTVSAFYMGKYQVTQAEYEAVIGTNPSYFKGSNLPVECVSWYDAAGYCNMLSQREGLTPAYMINGTNVNCDWNANGYRLPTEAEWEYACRAGTTTPFSTGNNITTSDANYDGSYPYNNNSKGIYRGRTTEVGSFSPNLWGLYDMHGNVEEWCWDIYGNYLSETQTDPHGAVSGSSRVLRGGSWFFSGQVLRSACREYNHPSWQYSNTTSGHIGYGFRLVRN